MRGLVISRPTAHQESAMQIRFTIVRKEWQSGLVPALCILSLSLFVISTALSQTHEGVSSPRSVKVRKAPELPPSLQCLVSFKEPSGNGMLDAEEEAYFEISVSNRGKGRASELQVTISPESSTGLSYNSSAPIGDIESGGQRSVRIPIVAAFEVESKKRSFTFVFNEANGFEPQPVRVTFGTKEFVAPELSVAQGLNIEDANNNGVIDQGELVKITARVQNRGQGEAKEVSAKVRLGSKDVFMTGDSREEFDLGTIPSGSFKDITFSIYTNMRATSVPVYVDLNEHYGKFGKRDILLPLVFNKPIPKMEEVVVRGTESNALPASFSSSPGIDVDMNIPQMQKKNPDAVAVVIGISRYKNQDVPSVDYAKRDAAVMKQYLINMFGYDERRILYVEDENASLSALKMLFEEQLKNYVKPGKSDVFVYYSGHGAPDPESKEAFFVPYDCNPTYAKSTGYRVNEFYNRLTQLKARSVTVVLDACFSGSTPKGMLLKQVSPIFVTVENPLMNIENSLLFSSSTGQQLSNWYAEKKHGLFTYYFLKGLQGAADANGDKQVTAEEMERYLMANVPDQARYLNNREQTPQVMTKDKRTVLVKY
jgi:hypothetical protein